jgi:hypothetical protein
MGATNKTGFELEIGFTAQFLRTNRNHNKLQQPTINLQPNPSSLTAEDSLHSDFELSESELLYDWRFTAYQLVLATSPLRPTTRIFIFQINTCGFSPYVTPSLMSLSFRIAPGPGQHSHSQVQVPRDSWPHFTVSDPRLPQPGGPGQRIYIPHGQGGLVILLM